MAWVVKSRPAELSSCRRAFSKELRGHRGKTYGMGGEEGERCNEDGSPNSSCELDSCQ